MTTDNQNNQNPNQNDYVFNIPETPKDAKQDDLLNSKGVTDGIIDYIKHADTPLSISLNGEWGSGKTSIMNTIKSHLCDDDAKFYSIWVNTWQFSLLDSSSAPQAVVRILQSIVNQIMVLKPDYKRKEHISQLIGTLATISSGLKSISDVAGDPLFGVGKTTLGLAAKLSNLLKNFFGNKFNNSQIDNAALVQQLSDEIQKLVDEVITTPRSQDGHYEPDNPCLISKIPNFPGAKFMYFAYFCLYNFAVMLIFIMYYFGIMCFNVIFGFIGGIILSIANSSSILKALFDFCCYVVRVGDAVCCNEECLNKEDKRKSFIFFIDDLDRIEPSLALEIIEMLASVFSFKKCIFIFAVDKMSLMEVVKLKLIDRGVNNIIFGSDENIDNQCKQYLDRFIHVSIPVFKEVYDIQPLLRESLIKISFFTPEELDDDLLRLLDNVISFSVGKNPRSIKQLINSLSLLLSFERHTWKYDDDEEPWQVNGLTKEMLFIMQCIKINYSKAFNALSVRPYFKTWNIDFAVKCFNINNPQLSIILARQCNASKDWEYALFHICNFNQHSQLEFYKLRKLFGVINDIFDKYLLEQNIKQSEQNVYTKILSDIFYYFYRIKGEEPEHGAGIYQEFIVKTSKEYRRNR